MTVRRSAAALATTAVLLGVAAPVAVAPVAVAAPSPSPSADLPAGLYGTTDPTYDGVWRQSLAFLAQKIEYVTPSTQAVDWLAGQQCDSGAFTSYRADTSKPCDASTVMDTNATAVAVQALVEINQRREDANNGADWLKSVQNEDGGWGYNPGSPSDANSTSIVIGALARTGVPVNELTTKNGSTPYTALQSLAIACGEKDGGAFAYQPGKKGELTANMDATAASVLGLMGKGIASGTSNAVKDPSCTKGD
ncbi:prenyltransferase/squalene oxidase repeat-containing protein, partial [Streptomyces rubiginosohelvolus]